MRCPPANQTDKTAEESRLHLICLASLNIFPSRGRLGTPRRRVFIHHAALCAAYRKRRRRSYIASLDISPYRASGTPASRAACGNSSVPSFPSLALAPHHLAPRANIIERGALTSFDRLRSTSLLRQQHITARSALLAVAHFLRQQHITARSALLARSARSFRHFAQLFRLGLSISPFFYCERFFLLLFMPFGCIMKVQARENHMRSRK